MKNIKVISLVALLAVLSVAFNGYGDGSSEKRSKVITENELFANPKIKATQQNTIIIELEHPDGVGHKIFGGRQINDIGKKGVDEVPVYYSKSFKHTFCWEDDTSDAEHKLELIDSSGNTVLTLYNNGKCQNAPLSADYYTMRFTHGGLNEGTRSIFIRPVEDSGSSRGASKQVFAHTSLTTNSCESCDLSGANLSMANLSNADLLRVNLSNADLLRVNLSNTDLTKANLSRANLPAADLTKANLSGANLTGADLTKANLPGANLTGADLTKANLSGANLTGAVLTGANLSFAMWFNGIICKEGSVGNCL